MSRLLGPFASSRLTQTDRAETPKEAWLIVALLFLFMVINFADKAVIGIAAVPMMQELRLSPSQFGLIGSSFYLLFSVSAVVTGFVANRVQTRWVLLVMGLVWAFDPVPDAREGRVRDCRCLPGRPRRRRGAGRSGRAAFAYKWFPNELRTLPTAIVVQGGAVGILMALPLLDWVIVRLFLALGLRRARHRWSRLEGGMAGAWSRRFARRCRSDRCGAASRTCWLRTTAVEPDDHRVLVREFRRLVGLVAGPFLARRIFDQRARPYAGLDRFLGALPAGATVVLVIAAGWYSQRLLARGVSSRVAREIFGGACVTLGGAALAMMPFCRAFPSRSPYRRSEWRYLRSST